MKPFFEQVELGRQQSIVAFRYDEPHFKTPWHFHPQHELTFIESSKGTRFVGDHIGSYEEGELVLIKSYLPHYWKNYADKARNSVSTVVQWNNGLIPELPEMQAVFEMIDASSRGIIYHKEDISSIIDSILALPDLSGSDLVLGQLDILAQLTQCRYETLSVNSFDHSFSSAYQKRMALLHEYIAEHYNTKVRLLDVAEIVGMTEQSFSRFFRKMMGQSFFKFLGVYRINIACRMLIDTDWPVSQIGYSCGYESIPFFYKQFKQLKGISPLKYRIEASGMSTVD